VNRRNCNFEGAKSMSLSQVFEAAGKRNRFTVSEFTTMPFGDASAQPMIRADAATCAFMMAAAANAGDLMAAARDHADTLHNLRAHESLLAEISKLCNDPRASNALAVIASRVAEFNS
jgi:predicted small metal-binding protein